MVISSQCLSEKKDTPCLRLTWGGRWAKSWAPQKAEFPRSLRVAWGQVYFEFCCEELKYDYHHEPSEKVRNCERVLPCDEVWVGVKWELQAKGHVILGMDSGLHCWVNEPSRAVRTEVSYAVPAGQSGTPFTDLLLCSDLVPVAMPWVTRLQMLWSVLSPMPQPYFPSITSWSLILHK